MEWNTQAFMYVYVKLDLGLFREKNHWIKKKGGRVEDVKHIWSGFTCNDLVRHVHEQTPSLDTDVARYRFNSYFKISFDYSGLQTIRNIHSAIWYACSERRNSS